MKGEMNKDGDDEFAFFDFLRDDLQRARVLLHGPSERVSGVRLWRGLLTPRFMPVLLCRTAHGLYRMKLEPLAKLVSFLNFFLFGIEIAVRCPIGRGLFFPHTHGTVIGAWRIGANATIFQGVTLGARELDFSYASAARPELGDNVTIGAGAKVLGGFFIGDHARVGANSVVLAAVPAYGLAVGAPARLVAREPGDAA